MPINPFTHYQQVLSMALEERSRGYVDLVSNVHPLSAVLKAKNLWQPYSGPRIRQTVQIAKPDGQWYSGYDFLENPPIELFNDVYYTPKMLAVPISLSMEEILNNEGENQVIDTLEAYMDAAESSAKDIFEVGLFSDGTANGGKQISGLNVALPIVNTTGTYAGIDRATTPAWRTQTYNANSDFPTLGTQVNSTTIRPMLNTIMMARQRGRQGADLLLMSPEHYAAYDAAIVPQQRITSERPGSLGSIGFTTLQYVGAGRSIQIVLAGGLGSSMPANTTFGIDTDSMRIRYNPQRNFDKLFEGDGQRPINQDAIAQYLGWMGELTMTNPLFNWRLYDSNPAA